MFLNNVLEWVKRNQKESFFVVFFGLFIYQVLRSFQGFELCDSGWYATYYQNIFSNPSSVEYNFLYWLAGIMGGLFVKMFPDSGLLGIRFLGILNIMAIIYLVYKLLYRYVDIIALNIGFIVIVLSYIHYPVEFSHNNFSALMFIGASFALFNGLEKNRIIYFVIAGLLLALNVFIRLPNILDIGIISIIIIYAFYNKEGKKICLQRISVLILSYFITIILVLSIMKMMGHYALYVDAVYGIKDVAAGKTMNTHGLLYMIKVNMHAYKNVFKDGSLLLILLLLFSYLFALPFFQNSKKNKLGLTVLFFCVFSFFMIRIPVIEVIYAFSLIGLIWGFYSNEYRLNVLSWMGLYMLIVMPLGSDWSIYNFNSAAVWLSVPLALSFFSNKVFNIQATIEDEAIKKIYAITIKGDCFKFASNVFLITFILCMIYETANTSYFDSGSRFDKIYKIDNDKLKGIFTTRERSLIVNDLLRGIKPYVKDGDYLLAYESIPMIYYLTNTVPFLNDSWLISSASKPLKQKIERLNKKKRGLPIVVRQKFETIGDFGLPNEKYLSNEREETLYVSGVQTAIFNKYLIDNNYKEVWSNAYFIIYAPNKDIYNIRLDVK